MASLRDKVHMALVRAVGDDARIELEDVVPDKIGGVVLSERFARLSPTERQDYIWRYLDEALTPYERTRVVFIVTDTAEEYEAVRSATG